MMRGRPDGSAWFRRKEEVAAIDGRHDLHDASCLGLEMKAQGRR